MARRDERGAAGPHRARRRTNRPGWRHGDHRVPERLVLLDRADTGDGHAHCLDPHDLVVAKLVAGREKDISFAIALIGEGIVKVDTLRDRAMALELPIDRARVEARISSCALKPAKPNRRSR